MLRARRELEDPVSAFCEAPCYGHDRSQDPGSAPQGGDLGEFMPGQMVKEFNDVVFSADVGKVHGPVQTQFGYHLIEITSRTD